MKKNLKKRKKPKPNRIEKQKKGVKFEKGLATLNRISNDLSKMASAFESHNPLTMAHSTIGYSLDRISYDLEEIAHKMSR